MEGVNPTRCGPGTRSAGAAAPRRSTPDAPEATRGFLLNHLITELLPEREGGYRFSNSDPITGQAAWYDLRVAHREGRRRTRPGETSPRFEPLQVPAVRNDRGGRAMTDLPATTGKKLGLVIDLDTCVGCQACATSCKEWNAGG